MRNSGSGSVPAKARIKRARNWLRYTCVEVQQRKLLGRGKFKWSFHSNGPFVDEAKSMAEKQLRTAEELKSILMQEIRKNLDCSSVQAVEIMPTPKRSALDSNWSVAVWTLEGEPSTPPCARDIEQDIQSKYALA
jgi:hypothetical protein